MEECNILIDELPHSVVVNDCIYDVNWGYRANIIMEICIFSDRSDEQKLLDCLNIFYCRNIPADVDQAVEKMLWFHRCGRSPDKPEDKKQPSGAQRPKRTGRAYCFDKDAALIFAAFFSQYGINLNRTANKDLHWWEFMAMFDSLGEDLLISRVMYYRTADTEGMSKKQEAFIMRMRKLHSLSDASSDMDSKAKLAKRNADMLAYVRERMDACKKE
ncbi:Gp15 family bacteriophage protein [Oscillospiraceae bacterium NTUH-002-81]|nr:Gp15 family bacteriophage protein [Oscillospiraceae bacterium NTUH-002-81]